MRLCVVVMIAGLLWFHQMPLALTAPDPALVREAGLSPVEPSESAKDFHLPDLAGQVHRLQNLRGKVVFLNFWATWCMPCRVEMPEMEQLFQAFRNRPFAMLAVAMQQHREQVAPFFTEYGLHYTALLDVEGKASARYAVRGLPTTLLIDCSGHLVGHVTGPRPWNTKAVHRLLAALLQDPKCG